MLGNKGHTHTHTHLNYVIIIAFPHQKYLHEHASMLRSYVHCLSGKWIDMKFQKVIIYIPDTYGSLKFWQWFLVFIIWEPITVLRRNHGVPTMICLVYLQRPVSALRSLTRSLCQSTDLQYVSLHHWFFFNKQREFNKILITGMCR